jgi:hypothetical protein
MTLEFLRYVLDDSRADPEYGPEWFPNWLVWRVHWLYLFLGKFSRAYCRYKGHPAGVWWFNMGENLEPDMHCKGCGEDIG